MVYKKVCEQVGIKVGTSETVEVIC